MAESHDGHRTHRVIVVGSVNIDFSIAADALPAPGETVLGRDFRRSLGGKGANQAVAASRYGISTALVAAVGDDDEGREAVASLMLDGIDTSGILSLPDEHTGVALISVDSHAQNQIVVAQGANGRLGRESVRRSLLSAADGSDHVAVLASLEIPLDSVIAASEVSVEQGWTLVVNPAPYQPLPSEVMSRIDVLTPNEVEAAALLGGPDWSDDPAALAGLFHSGVKALVVTLGPAGAVVITPDTRHDVPAPPVTAIDATGAGDVFNGVLAAELACGSSLEEAARVSVTAASLATTLPGARTAPPRVEVIRLMDSRA
jgi:ribokinase